MLGRLDWFKARRGRVMQRPEFSSIVVGMMLVMGIPAIFSAWWSRASYFDKNRYEFDPNKTWSVLEQGRGFNDLQGGRRGRQKRRWSGWPLERKNLVDNVKKLDEAMLALRAVAGTSAAGGADDPERPPASGRVRQSVGRGRPPAVDGLHRAAGRARTPRQPASPPAGRRHRPRPRAGRCRGHPRRAAAAPASA